MTSEENKSLANDVSIEKPKVSAVVKTDDRVEAKQIRWFGWFHDHVLLHQLELFHDVLKLVRKECY